MRKRFRVCLVLPVSVEIEADDDCGEAVVTKVHQVSLPSVSDIKDACTDDNLAALDEAFANAPEPK